MKEKGNKRMLRSFMAALLAFVLAFVPVLSSLPAIEAEAAGGTVTWKHVVAGENNGNAHSYEDAGTSPAAVLLNQSATMPLQGQFSAKVRFTNENPAEDARFAMFYTYQDASHWIYIGYDEGSKWYYQYQDGENGNYDSLTFSPSVPVPEAGKEYTITVALANEALQVGIVEGSNEYKAQGSVPALKTLAESVNGKGRFGFRAANAQSVATEFMFSDVAYTGMDDAADTWAFLLPALGSTVSDVVVSRYAVSGKVTDAEGKAVAEASVRLAGQSALTDAQGNYKVEDVEAGTYTLSVSAAGYEAVTKEITVADQNVTVDTIKLQKKQEVGYDTFIASGEMKVAIDPNFPRVMQYEMLTGDAAGKTFQGQADEIHTININKKSITPVLNAFEKGEDRAVYKMSLTDAASSIDLDMEVTISVKENDLTWEVTDIKKKNGCAKINTVEVPKLNLVTIDDGQTDAQFKGAVNSGDVNSSGDREITFGNGFSANTTNTYVYGFVSGNGLSAGLWSNSEALGDRRVVLNNGTNTMSLTSAAWYYEYGDSADSANYEHTPVSDLPCTKVCIAPDLNDDGVANWQDGAIAYRDIMNNPYGSENVPELVNYRIVMNLGSEATNPFMMSADNLKKVYLATDGLGQAIMLKGFGNEGHDSANSEYGDIGERIGGAEGFRKLINIAHQYNTEVGIHVNAQEAYAEAQTFSDDLIFGPSNTGWNWMDQAYVIDKVKDLGNGLRYKRILQLFDQLNGTSLYANKWPGVAGQGSDETVADADTIAKTVEQSIANGTNMDFIYLDVWYQDSWETRKIAQQFNSMGWRFSTEFGTTGEYDSTWQHWATDAPYGGSTSKGNNSEVMRFIRNHQKDSYVLNYPTYGGTADNPLLGHLFLNGFEGWSSNNNYNSYMINTYTENLPAKFLQHYQITKWVDYTGKDGDVSPVGNKEKEITLKSADGEDTVVVTRNEAQRSDSVIERTITLNGTKVLEDGAYLLPWKDSETGEEKLYHWNYDGGTTTWELLDDWKDCADVVVYELSDQGRGEAQEVEVVDGTITLTAPEKTAFVVLKGEEAPKTLKEGFGEGAHVTDPGFNSYAGTGEGTELNGDVWSGDITDQSIRVKKASNGDQYLVINSPSTDVEVSTQLYGLVPGQDYVAQVYVDNRSDAKAEIEVSGGKETVSNYTMKSIAENYIRADLHNRNAVSGSRMQIMLVSFTADADTATLTLRREAGTGYTNFDAIRVVAKSLYNYREDGTFIQDFESVVQGLYPFVMGSGQGVDDPSTHLSQYHAPYTQSGWGNVIIDDVISGQWSLKQHDSYKRTGIAYRTIPQNFRFEPGKTYEVSFDYQAGATNGFRIVIGDGENEKVVEQLPYLENTTRGKGQKSWTNHYSFNITGAADGQSWFGLYNNASSQGSSSFGAYDFIMDNLVIREAEAASVNMTLDKDSITFEGVSGSEKITANVNGEAEISFASLNPSIAAVSSDGTVTPVAFGETVISVTAKAGDQTLVGSVNVTVLKEGNRSLAYSNIYTNTAHSGEDGDKTVDGDESTLWHTAWTGYAVGEDNPAVITFELNGSQDFNTVRFQQRPSGSNGIIRKYQFVWGTSFDQATHTVTGGGSSEVITTSDAERANKAWVNVDISKIADKTKVKYLQIRVLEGTTNDANGPYAAIAEFQAYSYAQYPGSDPTGTVVEKSGLLSALKDMANINTFGLTAEDIKGINQVMEEAAAVLNSSNATEAQVEAKIASLVEKKAAVTTGKKAELQTMVAQCEGVDTGKYTADSVKIFENAVKAAKITISSETASAFDISNALYVLEKAQSSLAVDTKASARAELSDALAALKDIYTQGQEKYTEESWKAFAEAYKEAQSVLSNPAKSVEELERQTAALKSAQEDLVERNPDTEAARKDLSDALVSAEKYDKALYTTDSYAKLTIAILNAKKVLGDSKATKEQLVSALNTLNQAVQGLVKKQTVTPIPDPVPSPDNELKNGDTVPAGNLVYKVTNAAKKTVTVVKGKNKKLASVSIPATVKLKGETCKVTAINAKAFKGYARLKKVTIGKNVATIGKQAFYGCKKLTKVTFKGAAVKSVKSAAFKKTNAKLKVTLPKSLKGKKRTKVAKMLKKAGVKKAVK